MKKKNINIEEQKELIKNSFKENPIESGDIVYLLSYSWFNKWKQYTGYDSNQPNLEINIDKINNNHLLKDGKPKQHLSKDYDFIMLSQKTWNLFFKWYSGGPVIKLITILDPITKEPTPILNEWFFRVFFQNKSVQVTSHKYDSILELKKKSCEIFKQDPDLTILIDYWNENRITTLNESKYVFDSRIICFQDLLLELKNNKVLDKPRNNLMTRLNSSISTKFFTSYQVKSNGLIGFENLGNSCYLNSALQCLVHLDSLISLFLDKTWKVRINYNNRFGTNGILVSRFAELIDDYCYDYSSLSKLFFPYEFRFDWTEPNYYKYLFFYLLQLFLELLQFTSYHYYPPMLYDSANSLIFIFGDIEFKNEDYL